MKRGHKKILFACRNNPSIHRRENLRSTVHLRDIRRTDKSHGDFADPPAVSFRIKASELSSVSISDSKDIHCSEIATFVILDSLRKKQKSGTGSENRQPGKNTLPQRFKQFQIPQELSLYGTLAPGEDDTVDAVQICSLRQQLSKFASSTRTT